MCRCRVGVIFDGTKREKLKEIIVVAYLTIGLFWLETRMGVPILKSLCIRGRFKIIPRIKRVY